MTEESICQKGLIVNACTRPFRRILTESRFSVTLQLGKRSGSPWKEEKMRTPHFLRLAEIDEQHFITACRHGLVHLTWDRTTARFTRDEFRQLAGLLDRAVDARLPCTVRDGLLRVTIREDEDCELQLGPLVLLLTPAEFESFAQAIPEALRRLDNILASGVWDRQEPNDTPSDPLQQPYRNPFSNN